MGEWTVGETCTRALGVSEGFLSNTISLANGQNWISAWVKVEFDNGEADIAHCLKQAWKQVVQENPILNSCFFPNADDACNPRVETVLLDTQEKLDDWADRTFILDNKTDKAERYLSPGNHLSQFSLIWVTQTSEVMVHGPHGVNDSYGCLLTLNRLFELYGQANDPTPHPASVLSLRLTNTTQFLLNADHMRFESFQECLDSEFLRNELPMWIEAMQTPGGLPNIKQGSTSTGCRLIRVEFDEQETAQVVANAKSHGATVGQFLWAASVTALAKFPENIGKTFASTQVIDIRDQLDPNTLPCVAGVHVLGWPLAIPITSSLALNTKWVRNYMENYLPLLKTFPANNHPEFDDAVGAWKLFNASLPELVKSAPPSYSQLVSSIGVVDKFLKPQYNRLKVERFNVCSSQTTPGAHNLWHTFNNRLNASYCYADEFHNDKDMQAHADYTKQLLLKLN